MLLGLKYAEKEKEGERRGQGEEGKDRTIGKKGWKEKNKIVKKFLRLEVLTIRNNYNNNRKRKQGCRVRIKIATNNPTGDQ